MYANEIYVTLDDPLNKEEVLDHFNKTFDFAKKPNGFSARDRITSNPLKGCYYTHDTTFDFNPKGHRETNYVLLGIAFLILFIAGINFTKSHNLVDSPTIENDQYAPGIRMLHL